MKTYDIIIAGAGPGGLGAALKAASLGLTAALIERRSRLAPLTRACSEGLLHDEFYFGDSITVNKAQGTIDFKHSGFSLAYTGQTRAVTSFINVSRSGKQMKLVRENGLPIHLVFDKGRYLEENLSRAIEAGISFFPDQNVTGTASTPDGVTVHTNKESFRARFLVAADGLNSACARFAGFNRDRKFYGTLNAACWHIRGFEPEETAHIHLLEGSDDPSAFCICPGVQEGEWSVVISGFENTPDYAKRFEQVQDKSALSKYFHNVQVIRRSACILNLCEPLKNPCRDNVFVIGDGAWFGQTSNTHAALTGAKAVECIHSALNNGLSGDAAYLPYRTWWTENFVNYLKVPGGGNMFELLTADEIDEFFSYMPGEIVASMEPKKAGQLLGAFFQKLLSEIQQKNPGLVQRIAAIQKLTADEAWKEKQKAGFPVPESAE
ncbi:MAG: FAD-dependent monooxygenase [Deltaproteobacteria bacterium]|nr:FAD-dependent monooxygenase [Deltaproteobacteria bacterium]